MLHQLVELRLGEVLHIGEDALYDCASRDQPVGSLLSCFLAEGDAQNRDDLIYLEKLPVFNAKGEIIG